MSAYTDVERFLQAVFGSDFGTRVIFANLHPAVHMRELQQLDAGRDCYWSIAAFDPDHTERHLTRALEVRALVIDDVGTKVPAPSVELALGRPTAVVQTSAGNFQWVYRLAPAIPVDQWPEFWRAVEMLVGCALEGKDAVHLFRLPLGVNTKPGKNRFVVRLDQLNSGIELSGIVFNTGLKTTKSEPVAVGTYDRAKLESLMQLVPNDVERDGWIEVGHGLKALCEDDEDGFEVFDHWSLQHPSYDAAKTRTAWDSFGASGLRTEGGKLRARAETLNPQGYAKWVFDDGVGPEITPGSKANGITATPFKWMDLSKTEPRDWLYGDILLRKFISMTVAPGGTGKSSLVAVETLAQITGRNLLGEELPAGELRVWLWNLEDTFGETQKKILAAAKHYGVSEADIGDRLFVDSGRDQRLVIAEMRGSTPVIVRLVVDALVSEIKRRRIDVIVVDPFVSCHQVPENDNMAQDMVLKQWGQVAELGNCAVHLVDHTSKAGSKEVVTDSSRGAKAKTDAARVVRVVNRMTDTDGKTYGIVDTWRYFNTFNDKANMAPPKSRRDWFRMESIWADNGAKAAQVFSVGAAANTLGDSMGVVVQWTPPSAKTMAGGDAYTKVVKAMGDKRWRTNVQSPDWIGIAVAEGCGLLHHSTADKLSVKEIIKKWISEGLFKVVMQPDQNRMMKEYIEIAQVY